MLIKNCKNCKNNHTNAKIGGVIVIAEANIDRVPGRVERRLLIGAEV